MPNDQEIAAAIHARLVSDQTAGSFFDDLGGLIYEAQARQDKAMPLCVFTIISMRPYLAFADSDDRDGDLQIDIFHKRTAKGGPRAVRALNDKLITLLDRQSIAVEGYSKVTVFCTDRGTPQVEEDLFRQMSQWIISASAA